MPGRSTRRLWTIGELARATGVPVKTIRHYSDIGVLPPVRVTDARYRLYADDARFRLDLIRQLRSLDFDLGTIGRLLSRKAAVRDRLRWQLGAIDAALRRLRRTRAVFARAIDAPTDAEALETLRRLHLIASLDAVERSGLLRATMEAHLRDVPADPDWQRRLWDAAFKDLPDELTDAQWEALLELHDLVADEDFGRRLAEQSREHWSRAAGTDLRASQRQMRRLVAVAARAADRNEPATSARARRLVSRFVGLSARAARRAPTASFRRQLLERAARHDPRAERFWELIGIVRGWPPGPQPQVRAFRWLFAALRDQLPPSGARVRRSGAKDLDRIDAHGAPRGHD